MSVHITIDGATADEALDDLGRLAKSLLRPTPPVADLDPVVVEALAKAGPGEIIRTEPEPPTRKPRAKKAEAEKPAEGVVSTEPEKEPEAPETKAEEVVSTEPEKEPEAKPLTRDEVRNSIIDLLNAVVEKHPDDADIRVKTLKPLLDKLGAAKISEIKDEDFGKVPALLAEIREQEGL